MPRNPNKSTVQAIKLIGTLRKDGKPHTPYSAAKEVDANRHAVYKYIKSHPELLGEKK